MASGPITLWQMVGETIERLTDFIFLSFKITADGDFSHEIKRRFLLGRKAMTNLDSILKTIALTTWTFLGKVMSLLFNILSRFLLAFLPKSKHLLTLWLQAPSAVILKLKKIKSVTVSTFTPSVCHEVIGLDSITGETHIERT